VRSGGCDDEGGARWRAVYEDDGWMMDSVTIYRP
jgi:hypothetical protein